MRPLALGLTLGLSAAACGGNTIERAAQQSGGAAGTSGAGGTGARAGSGGTGGGDFALTSYDLRFVDVVTSTAPFPVESPSLKTDVRIDLRAEGTGVLAVATPRWGQPEELAVTVEAGRITLSGAVRIHGEGTLETWDTVVIARDASGRLDAPVGLSGKQSIMQGDVAWDLDARATASIAVDATPPAFRVVQRSAHASPDYLLPWDALVSQAAEGVDPAAFVGAIRLGGPAPWPPIAWQTEPSPSDTTAPSGSIRAHGRWQRWPDAGIDLLIAMAPGVPDPVGHRAPAIESLFKVMFFPPVQGKEDLQGPGSSVGMWGQALLVEGDSDPRCDGTGCVVLGPVDNGICPAAYSGFAGRVITSKPGLALRYRVLVGPAFEPPTEPPSFTTFFNVETALPGSSATAQRIEVDPATLEPLPAPLGKLRWSTPWTTLSVATPAAGDTGYSVYLEPCSAAGAARAGPAPPVPMALLVDSVSG